jgi:hypothetical protein
VVSEVALRRRLRTGIFEAGDARTEFRSVTRCASCAREASPPNVEVAALPARSCWDELNVVAGKRGASRTVSTPAASSSVPSNVGIPYPGAVASCPPTTSPKNGCRPVDAGLFPGEAIFFRVGEVWWSRLLLLPVVRRVLGGLRGADGAGWGRSRGFRLLNLYAPYVASLFGRAAEAVEETDAFERLAGS